ncbi:MAG: helix-turn-helix domain-containing protein [Planctomycetes bacterium]|nr:helix-turn-helix domain-containing protein [Planctomycetota bacterium]
MLVTTTPRHLLSRREASTYLAISPRKLDSLTADGSLPRVKIGSCVRFEQADLDAFIAAQKSA